MTTVPVNQKIYHITPVDNLPAIISAGELRSDALMVAAGGPAVTIGMGKLKLRRLDELSISCLGGVMVGACVPFYFCPRSVMLYLIHMRSPEVAYKGGQVAIVHLEADLGEVLAWATREHRPWAFSLSNAAARYSEFRSRADQLNDVDWQAVRMTNWRNVKERKQAEFLVVDTFPLSLFRVVGVQSSQIAERVTRLLDLAETEGLLSTRPLVQYRPTWYY